MCMEKMGFDAKGVVSHQLIQTYDAMFHRGLRVEGVSRPRHAGGPTFNLVMPS